MNFANKFYPKIGLFEYKFQDFQQKIRFFQQFQK